MRTFQSCTILVVLSVIAAGCGTTSSFTEQITSPPVEPAELQQQADGMLDYLDGKTAALPQSLLEGAPLAHTDEDAAQKMMLAADAMRARAGEIADLKARNALGEDNRGYLTLRSTDYLANADEKNLLQQVMAAENENRKDFYRAMARTREERGLTLTQVERVFAARRIVRAPSGVLMQLPRDGAEFDRLKASPLGAALGETCQPGVWVKIP